MKNITKKNSNVRATKQKTLILIANCAIYGKKIQGSLKIKKRADY